MRRFAPGEETLNLVLEREHDPNPALVSTLRLSLSPSLYPLPTHLALNRRKFCVINGKLNPGRLGSSAVLSPASTASPSFFSSTGNICCKNLHVSAVSHIHPRKANACILHTW